MKATVTINIDIDALDADDDSYARAIVDDIAGCVFDQVNNGVCLMAANNPHGLHAKDRPWSAHYRTHTFTISGAGAAVIETTVSRD